MSSSEISFIICPEPGAVQNFTINQPADTAQRLELNVICPEERRRNGLITEFTYRSTVEGDTRVSYDE